MTKAQDMYNIQNQSRLIIFLRSRIEPRTLALNISEALALQNQKLWFYDRYNKTKILLDPWPRDKSSETTKNVYNTTNFARPQILQDRKIFCKTTKSFTRPQNIYKTTQNYSEHQNTIFFSLVKVRVKVKEQLSNS